MDKSIEAYVKRFIADLRCNEEEKNEVEDEMRDHLYLLVQEYLEEGYSNEEAVQKAIQAFGEGKEIRKGLQKSLSPFYRLIQYGLWISFSLYAFVLLGQLLVLRLIRSVSMGFNPYFSLLDSQTGGPFIIFNKEIFSMNTNFIPFESIYNYISNYDHFNFNIILHNTIGNILIFIPLGVFFSLLLSKEETLSKAIFFFLSCSFSIEVLQYTLRVGQFDIDDVILNTVGGIAGYCIVKLTKQGLTFSRRNVSKIEFGK